MKSVSFALEHGQTATVTIIGEGEEIQVALQVYDGFDHCEITMDPYDADELAGAIFDFAAKVRDLRAQRKGDVVS